MQRLFVAFFCLTAIWGCASTGREGADELRNLLIQKKNQEALVFAEGKKFYDDDKDRLLKLVETATLHFFNNNYYQALKKFDDAKELSDKLFTVSISKKISTVVSNDNSDNYYGERFERSMIRYYQALLHYMLFLKGTYEEYKVGNKETEKIIPVKYLTDAERRVHLQSARSVLIEWDSLLSSYKATLGGEATYKDDLLAKLFGAIIHQELGSSNDIQIATNLYKSAKDVLLKYYNLYPVYNSKFSDFKNDYEKLPKLSENELKKYIAETEEQKKLLDFINDALKALKDKKELNVHFVIEDSFINRKIANIVDVPLPHGMVPVGISSGDSNFGIFTLQLLSVSTGMVPKFYFEIPELKDDLKVRDIKIIVKNEQESVIKTLSPVLVNPMSSIGHFQRDEEKAGIILKTSARVIGKQIAALGSAYAIYQTQKKNLGGELAMLAATATYQIANKTIEFSERANLRSWATLPRSFYLVSDNLPPGNYKIYLSEKGAETFQEKIEVIKGGPFVFKSIRLLE